MAEIELNNWDVVIIARDKWGDVRRRRHCLAHEWSKTRKALFVEPPFSLPARLIGRKSVHGASVPRQLNAAREVAYNIFVTTPIKLLPNSIPGARDLNMRIGAASIRNVARRLCFRNTVLWVTAEYGVHFADRVPHDLLVYDVTDDWTHATLPPRERKQIIDDDARLLRAADVVFTVSRSLFDSKSLHNPNTRLMPNGVMIDAYDNVSPEPPEELDSIDGPIVGYIGSLHDDRLDVELIERVAQTADSRFSLVFVGPDSLSAESRDRLLKHSNVHILPPVHFDHLPVLIGGFDVCMIPHLVTPFTNSLNPLKAFEYLASGAPVLSTPVDEMLAFDDLVSIARTPGEFLDAILAILAGNEKSTPEKRRAAAAEHSWANRAAAIDKQILKTLKALKDI